MNHPDPMTSCRSEVTLCVCVCVKTNVSGGSSEAGSGDGVIQHALVTTGAY